MQNKVNSKKGRNISNYVEQSQPSGIEPMLTIDKISPIKTDNEETKQELEYQIVETNNMLTSDDSTRFIVKQITTHEIINSYFTSGGSAGAGNNT